MKIAALIERFRSEHIKMPEIVGVHSFSGDA